MAYTAKNVVDACNASRQSALNDAADHMQRIVDARRKRDMAAMGMRPRSHTETPIFWYEGIPSEIRALDAIKADGETQFELDMNDDHP